MSTPIEIHSAAELTQLLQQNDAVLLLFGATHCGVCQSIKPRIGDMLRDEFSQMKWAYIDCHTHPAIAAAHHVFSLPVVELYFYGQAFARFAKVFSIRDVKEAIARPYQMLD